MNKENKKPKDIKQLMTDADELIRQINSDAIQNMKEEHRLLFHKNKNHLEKMKFALESDTGKKEPSAPHSAGEGMHEAILDIVKAFQQLKTDIP